MRINSGKLNSLSSDLAALDAMERSAWAFSMDNSRGVEIMGRKPHDFGAEVNQRIADAVNEAITKAVVPFREEIEKRIRELATAEVSR